MKKSQITIHDIAKQLNISASTVSRALADHPRISKATKERVQKLALQLKYSPNSLASSLRRGKGNVLGVIVPKINRHFFSNVIEGIEREASMAGYSVMICQSQERLETEASHIKTLLNARVDGIIMSISTETKSSDHLYPVIDREIPLIFFDRVLKDLPVSCVELDDYAGAYAMVTHMIEQGCRRIAYFGGPQHINVYQNRRLGYMDALLEHGLDIESNILFEDVLTREKGYEKASLIFSNKNSEWADAIFSASDFSALGAILYLHENGYRVPRNIAVAGFANEPFTSLSNPTLSTVEQNARIMGETAARLLLEQVLEDKPLTIVKHKMIKPELIVRESTLYGKN